MFDFDFEKLIIFGIVALVAIPPKDLPRVMRAIGQAMAKMRRMAAEFRGQFMEAMREAELDEIKNELANVRKELTDFERSANVELAFDPATAARQELARAVEAPKEIGVSAVALDDAPPAEGAPDAPPPAPNPQAEPAAAATAAKDAAE